MRFVRGIVLITLLSRRVLGEGDDYYYAETTTAPQTAPSDNTASTPSSEKDPIPSDSTTVNETTSEDTIRDIIEQQTNLNLFRKSLTATGLIETVMGNSTANVTVFAPVDDAIKASAQWSRYLENTDPWKPQLRDTVINHIVTGMMSATEVYEADVGSVDSWLDMLENNPIYNTVENAKILQSFKTANGYLHITDGVFMPKFYDSDLADMEVMPELGPDRDVEQRLALTDVVDFLEARDYYSKVTTEGITHVACRIRAFNRMEDYFTQTINLSPSVKYGELMNASFKDETIHNFVEYSIINRIYDADRMEHGYEELIMSQNGCAHMWVTKHAEKLCFNDACLVISPPAFSPSGTPPSKRIQIATNGIAYVTDKCVICPGTAMLANYAAEYTMHNMKDFAQFFVSSEWNLRNLSLSIGNGSAVTLLGGDTEAFSQVTGTDTTRLSTDMWRPHLQDFLKHMTLQGNLTAADLKKMTEEAGGALNVTTLANQTILLAIDQERDSLTIEGGEIKYPDIFGVDGTVHFISTVPLVRSVTHSVYDIGWWLGLQEQLNLIDAVFLRSDMKRLEPLTAVFAADEDWRNKIIPIESIEPVLENHLFEGLWWCHTMVEFSKDPAKRSVDSINGQTWFISVNENGFPCFDVQLDFGVETARSCITQCDILARNGIVHVVDKVILSESVETRQPSPPPPPGARPPLDPQTGGIPVNQNGPNLEDLALIFKRPKRQYERDEFSTENSSTGTSGQLSLVAAVLPFLMLL